MAHICLTVLSMITAFLFALPAQYSRGRMTSTCADAAHRADVVAIRHGATHADQAENDPLNHKNVAKAATMNAKGEEAVRALGDAFKSMNVPVSKAITSHFTCAYQTVKLAGFDNVEKSIDTTEGGLVFRPTRTTGARRDSEVGKHVPPAGSNVIIVSHKPTPSMSSARTGSRSKRRGDDLQADGTGYNVYARVQTDEWPRIAAVDEEMKRSIGQL